MAVDPHNDLVPDAQETLSLAAQKEQEALSLRDSARRQLETRLETKDEQLKKVSATLARLHQDFQYNLKLIEERDAELQQYDVDATRLNAAVAERDRQLAELHAELAARQSELRVERGKYAEAEFLWDARSLELQRTLEDAQLGGSEALLRQREEQDQARHALQRSLAELQEELERQRREMTVGFSAETRRLEALYASQRDDALQAAKVAQELARQRGEEAAAAQTRALEQARLAEASAAEAKASEQQLRAVTWELDNVRQLKDHRTRELEEQCRTLASDVKERSERARHVEEDLKMQVQAAKVQAQAALARSEAERDDARALAERREVQHAEEVGLLRAKLEQAAARQADAEAALFEVHAALRVSRADMQGRIDALERERQHQKETAEMAFGDYERRREGEARELKEKMWQRDEELKVVREKLDGVRRALDERRADLTHLQEQLVLSHDRERQMQRKLVQSELLLEQRSGEAAHLAHHDGLMRTTVDQLNTANVALQDALERLQHKETEVKELNAQLARAIASAARSAAAASNQPSPHSASAHTHVAAAGVNPAAAQASSGPSRRAPPPPMLSVHDNPVAPGDAPQQRLRPGAAAAHSPGGVSDSAAGGDGGGGSSSAAMSMLGDSFDDGLPDLNAMLASPALPPLPMYAGTAPSSSSFAFASSPRMRASGRENRAGQTTQSGLSAGAAAAGDVAAAAGDERSALVWQDLRDELDTGSPLDSPRGGSPRRGWTIAQYQQALALAQDENQRLEAQNQRLQNSLGIMRSEVEAMQSSSTAVAQVTPLQPLPPQQVVPVAGRLALSTDVAVLQEELYESDRDLQRALEHIDVLQRQLAPPAASTSATASDGISGGTAAATASEPTELVYLRQRVRETLIENRNLRRQAVQLRLDAAAAAEEAAAAVAAAEAAAAAETWAGSAGGLDRVDGGAAGSAAREALLQEQVEQLMDVSNALRSERDRLLTRLQSGVDDQPIDDTYVSDGGDYSSPSGATAGERSPQWQQQQQPGTSSGPLQPWPVHDRSRSPSPQRGARGQRGTSGFAGGNSQRVRSDEPPPQGGGGGNVFGVHGVPVAQGSAAASGSGVLPGIPVQIISSSGSSGGARGATATLTTVTAAGFRPPSAVPGSSSTRETASQRARLLALQLSQQERAAAAARPKARNYNQQDDASA